jgi:hypothetical protein
MEILTAKDYNNEDMQKWHERVEKWRDDKSNNIIPQIAFVGFRKRNGELKNYGYVAKNENGACWARTKKEVILKYQTL